MFIITGKKRKKLLLKPLNDIKAIHDEYYELKIFENRVFERSYVVERHKHHTKDIIKRYGLNSIAELIFLLHRYCGKVVKECEFCGHTITEIKTRTGNSPSRDDCRCAGICPLCNEVFKYANDDGICYRCKPHYHEDENLSEDPNMVLYRFLQCVGNTDRIIYIQDATEAKRMMDLAAEFYHWFKNRHDELLSEQ
jgi:hypothetical protein